MQRQTRSGFRVSRLVLIVLLGLFVLLSLAAKKCPKCGKEYDDDQNFCAMCEDSAGGPVRLKPVEKPRPKPKAPRAESSQPQAPAGTQYVSRGRNAQGYDEILWLKDSSVMIRIPAGVFTMGSDDGGSGEKPVHQVYLDEYYIDKYEVTNRQYKKFCDATGRSYPPDPDFLAMANYITNYPSYPVVNVSWEDAKAYCNWAGKRLPTEAEWEKAARGTDARKYPWGNSEPNAGGIYRANYDPGSYTEDGYARTAPVGSFERGASHYGCLDMAGNVWEWCNDWYDENHYNASPRNNPQGPLSGSYRVLRGGSWGIDARYLRCAYRFRLDPSYRNYYLGFRCSLRQ